MYICYSMYRIAKVQVFLIIFINRHLSQLGIMIPKLFGKHIKIDQQKKVLSRYTPIAIGVPNRVLRLVEEGILDLSNISHIIIDMKE